MISAGAFFNRKYYNFESIKISRLISTLKNAGAAIGLHLSHEAGIDPKNILREANRLKKRLGINSVISRHHYLRWREPEDIIYMEQAGITDDFTLSYVDHIGFRVGTCHSYRFINPQTKTLTNIMIHPLEIMDVTLDGIEYMNLDFQDAFIKCKEIISQVIKHNGELNLLWHNDAFVFNEKYYGILYKSIIEYIQDILK